MSIIFHFEGGRIFSVNGELLLRVDDTDGIDHRCVLRLEGHIADPKIFAKYFSPIPIDAVTTPLFYEINTVDSVEIDGTFWKVFPSNPAENKGTSYFPYVYTSKFGPKGTNFVVYALVSPL